jgi:ribonuclease P protein component
LTSPYFAAFCRRQPEQSQARFGFTVPRALGKAVRRNRIKRRMREAVRLEGWRLGPHWQIVFNPRRQAFDAPFESVRQEVEKLFVRCGAL